MSKLLFGANKYCALNQILAKWLGELGSPIEPYWYVTLGGTELRDVSFMTWIDRRLTSKVISFEQDPDRYKLAQQSLSRLHEKSVDAELVPDDIFSYRRSNDGPPHIFYLDLLGICSPNPYRREFQQWFENDILRPGDILLITSYLGRNPGWEKVLNQFDSEFRLLRVSSMEEKKHLYDVFHPMFVLFRSLIDAGLNHEMSVRCFASVKYRDSSTMGLYGIVCQETRSNLGDTIAGTPFFNSINDSWGAL
jgi:hypothetical protein